MTIFDLQEPEPILVLLIALKLPKLDSPSVLHPPDMHLLKRPGSLVPLRIDGSQDNDEILVREDIVHVDANVAARLEAVAPPGGIAVSAAVRDQVGNRLDLTFEDIGALDLKNIARPIHVFHVLLDGSTGAAPPPWQPALTLPNKPSIAVLPFANWI